MLTVSQRDILAVAITNRCVGEDAGYNEWIEEYEKHRRNIKEYDEQRSNVGEDKVPSKNNISM